MRNAAELCSRPEIPKSYVGKPLWDRLRWNRPLTSYSRVQALVGSVLRNRYRGRATRAEYLNAGCGPNKLPGFVNLDYCWAPGIDVCWDLSRPLPFADGSLQGIFTEHCLEHLPIDVCSHALREFWRCLRPGGVLRVVVPDAELFVRAYAQIRSGQDARFPGVDAPRSEWTPMREVNRIFRDHGHQFAYDFETMQQLLAQSGFQHVAKESFGHGRDPHLLIDSEGRRDESMYVEAVR